LKSDDAAYVAARSINLLVNPHFAEYIRRQRSYDRYSNRLVGVGDHSEWLRRTDQEMTHVQTNAAVAVGVRESRAGYGT